MAETLKALEAQIVKLKNANKCDLCDYTAASSTALKTHITKKHKESSHPSPERERHSMNLSDSLNVSLPIDRREEAMVDFAEEKSIQCQWIYCRHVANSSSDMVEHVSRAHTITSTFVYPESSEKEYCDLCGIEFFWTIHMQCTSSTPTTVVLNVIIVMNIFLDVRVGSLKFT